MQTRRGFLAYGIGVVGAAVLAACSSPPDVPAAGPGSVATPAPSSLSAAALSTEAAQLTAASAGHLTPIAATGAGTAAGGAIQVATRAGGDAQIMARTVQAFSKQTGTRASAVDYGPETDYWPKVAARFATRQVADVLWAGTGNLFGLASRGIVHELDSIIKADNYDLSDYVPNALKSLTLKGQLFALPWGTQPGNGGLVYSVQALNDAGFTKVTDDPETLLDWTYEMLMQAAIKATRRTGSRVDAYGYYPGDDYLSLTNVLGAYGADFLNADGTTLTMDTPEFLKGMQWIYDAYVTNRVAPVPAPSLNADQLFDGKKLVLELSGYRGQFRPGITDSSFTWNDTLQPTGPAGKRGTHLTIDGQAISAITPHPKEAWEFLKFIMTPEQNVPVVLSGGCPAARKAVLNDPALMAALKAHKVWVLEIEAAEPWREPANFRWPEFNATIQQAFATCWSGQQTPEQALPNATKLLQAVLDKPAET